MWHVFLKFMNLKIFQMLKLKQIKKINRQVLVVYL